jgi:hypothetical protein
VLVDDLGRDPHSGVVSGPVHTDNPANLAVVAGTPYLIADDRIHGRQVWRAAQSFAGDIDRDGTLNEADLLTLRAHFSRPTYRGTAAGDLNEDGRVDFEDFLLLWEAFARQRKA